eukprot:SAG22_NODE_1613_length_3995_cov_4.374230_4_plen_51_part_00
MPPTQQRIRSPMLYNVMCVVVRVFEQMYHILYSPHNTRGSNPADDFCGGI